MNIFQDLRLLLRRYLDPMKDENFMSQSEVQALVATVHEILNFQVKFLQEIERPLKPETGFHEFSSIEQFQVSLSSELPIPIFGGSLGTRLICGRFISVVFCVW